MDKTADAVVIGGGINGCCTAYYLAKKGMKNIVLVEKGHIASGPTGRSSGIVRQHYTHETLAAMARDGVNVWKNFADEIGGDAGFVKCGVIFFAGEKDAELLQKTVAMHQRIGIREELLSAAELKKMEPALFADDIAWGAYELDGGYADPALAANSFSEAAEREGVTVMKKTPVTGLKIDARKIKGVITTKGDISTDVVINVAGPWGGQIAAMAGVHIPIKASRHPVVILQKPTNWRKSTPVWCDLVTGWYFKPERNTAMMIGSMHDFDDAADIDGHSTVPTYQEIETFSDAILHRFPIMEEGAAQGGWAGLYDVTPDWQPVVDKISEVQGFYCAVGFSGSGFKIGPSVGRVMAELVIDGKCTSYDIDLFRHARFQQKQSSRGAYGGLGIVG
jgi:sarcosine oxidase subunit beta